VEKILVHQRPRRALRASLAARAVRIAVPATLVGVTAIGITAGVWGAKDAQIAYPASVASVPAASSAPIVTTVREERASRGLTGTRPAPSAKATKKAKPMSGTVKGKVKEVKLPRPALTVTGTKYATVGLNIRTVPTQSSKVITVVPTGTKLSVTNSTYKGFRFVSYKGAGRWVKNQYLSNKKPKAKAASASGGISGAPCKLGSKVESGLTRDAISVHRAMCARYPQVTSFGGRRSSADFHGSGRAIDAMISNSTVGWQMANWVRANAKRLGVSEVIYSQKIWTVQRGSEGWRSMSDRGSKTANHYDHVHVSVYGNRGTG
jgi:hypothetical protein